MNDTIKYKILKEFAKTYIERSYDGMNYTESRKSLSLEELNIKTNVKPDNLSKILNSLRYNDYIKSICKTKEHKKIRLVCTNRIL